LKTRGKDFEGQKTGRRNETAEREGIDSEESLQGLEGIA